MTVTHAATGSRKAEQISSTLGLKMNLEDKFLNSMGMPTRIHSVRDAIKYFDENPALTANTPIAQADGSREQVPQFRHPPAGEMMSGDFRKAPMHYRGTFTDTTRFSGNHDVLPAERLKETGARDKLSDNIAARMKRDLQLRLLEGGRRPGGWLDARTRRGRICREC